MLSLFSPDTFTLFKGIHSISVDKKFSIFFSTEIEWVPLNTVNLSGENKDNMIKFLETLDDDEDVQNIFTNAKFEN